MSVTRDFRAAVGELVGLECWAVAAVVHRGSFFTLHLGDRLARPDEVPAKNARLRKHEGQYKLGVSFAAWRIQTTRAVLASWDDAGRDDEEKVRQLEALQDHRVARVQLVAPAWDLSVVFDHSISLRIFPTSTPRTNDLDYWLDTPAHAFTISEGGRVKESERRPPRGPRLPAARTDD